METREKFEALPDVAIIFEGLHPTIIWFCETANRYATSFSGFDNKVVWLNGAWYAFQEQEKKLKELEEALTDVQYMCHKSISFEHDLFDKGWNQASRQTVINIHRLTGIGERLLNESKPL